MHILLVEDDDNLGLLMVDLLETEDYKVSLSRDGHAGWEDFQNGTFDLCLLDVMLPENDGFSLAMQIRTINAQVPIIFITAKNLLDDKLIGFDVGADDYITKPFDAEELLCRVKAVLKRSMMPQLAIQMPQMPAQGLRLGAYTIDPHTFSLIYGGEKKRKLTQRELDLLHILLLDKNKLVKRSDILEKLWGENDYFHGRSLDVFIARLRKYLKDDPAIKIENIHSQGFILFCS